MRQNPHVGGGQVEALGAGGRHDVRGVAGQKQAAVLHRLGHEAAHGGDALLKDGTLVETKAIDGLEALMQLLPDSLVGPFGEVLVGTALQIQTADLRECAC